VAGGAETQARQLRAAVVEAEGRTFSAGQDPRTGQFRDPHKAHHTVGNIKYTSPITNKLLLEGGYSWTLFDWHGGPDVGIIKPRGTPEWYAYAQKISNQRMIDPQCAYGVDSECPPGAPTGARASASARTTRASCSTAACRT
jgi:hypothetical protein